LQLHGWVTSLQLRMWGRTVWTRWGLFDVPGGLWTVSADDHHNDGDDPGDTRVLPDDDRATPLRRAVQRAVWGPPVPAGSDLRRRGGGHVRVRRAARALRHGQRLHVRSGSLPHRHAVRVAVRAARVRGRLRMPL